MPKYITKNQLIGDIGEAFVSYVLSSKLHIIYRPISKRDTGIDGEIEITEKDKYSDKYIATGIFIKVQIKSSSTKEFTQGKLSISLTDNDIEYLSEGNLPCIILFVDLRTEKHNVYWCLVDYKHCEKSKTVEITKKKKVREKTVDYFKKIESFYRGRLCREYLIDIFSMNKNLILEHTNNLLNENDYGYVISDLFEEIENLCKSYQLSFIKAEKYGENLDKFISDDEFFVLDKMRDELKKEVNVILLRKNFNELDFYISEE